MNSMFVSAGEDPFAHLRKHLEAVPRANFEGAWATVELQPDQFARQRYTVGVAVASMEGAFSFRLLDDLVKFECLYGRDDVSELRMLIESAEQALLRASQQKLPLSDVQFDSAAISLGDLWPTAGESIDAVLNRLFTEVVPFLPRENRKVRDFVTLDNVAVRRLVDEELKRIAGLSFERIRTEPLRTFRDQATDESHSLEFNLEPPGKAGSVISAVYKTLDKVELNLLRASRDLTTYAKLRNLADRQLALFVMTPVPESMSPAEYERLDNVIGEQSWSLEKRGFVVSAHPEAGHLAKDVFEWADVARDR